MAPTDPQHRTPEARTRAVLWSTVGKAALGVGLLLAVMALTILRNDDAAGTHALGSTTASAQPPAAVATSAAPTTTTALTELERARAEGGYLVVEAASDPVKIYDKVPPGSVLSHTLPRTGDLDVVATFWAVDEAVDDQGRTWYQIYVPVRPNETKGWVKAADVTTHVLTHDVRIDLSEHRLDLYDRGALVRSYEIGVGKGDTPTPPGEYFITIKMKPPNPGGVYGVLAMGISAYSEKLTDWPGGGQVGVHGTNDPGTIGTDVSHGCIRLRNEDILELSNDAHLGTPVFIQE